CDVVQCPNTEVCDPLSGDCIPDPCQGVTCPADQQCHMGQCGTPKSQGLHVTVGGGGCNAGGGESSALVALALLGLVWRRRRRAALACAVLACSIAAAGCNVNDYCIACETEGDGGISPGDDGGSGSGSDSGPSCDPMQVHTEVCNGADDDCDGNIDETFDLQTDHDNCGACGNACDKAGAQTACTAGACTIIGCFPGFFDENDDTTGPYDQSDGCEYQCFQSNGGVEACDGLDNDCDGTLDEGFDVTDDINNCGACNHVCQFFKATPHCNTTTCEFDPLTDCDAGYHDIDGQQANGCEYQCNPSNGGVEACDLVDNDCDGAVDETFSLMSDIANCGRCGLQCSFPHATPSCMIGMCGFNPATDCDAGFVDIDGKQLNGCEYQCTPTNGGVEICDAIDNDCNGVADDNPTDAGAACSSTMPPQGACVADGLLTCSAGVLVCNGETEPAPEVCNNSDDDCNGPIDDGVTMSCYTGPANTNGVGACHAGVSSCSAGMFGACSGEVTPGIEVCNNIDDDCNGMIDDGPGNTPIVTSCYSGAPGTAGVGTCKAGTSTCAFGAPGPCLGEIVPAADICGDALDTDCDALDDSQEGCLSVEAEKRLDAPGGSLGETNGGTEHSYDVVLARGGSPVGTNVYAVWSQLVGSSTEVYFRASTDGGQTWGTIKNLSTSGTQSAVKPQIAVAPGATDTVVVAYQTVNSGVRSIRVRVSTDGGGTFSSQSSALNSSGDAFHHVVAISGTTCVVAWENLNTSTLNRDVLSRTSTNSCASFNGETKINVGSPSTRFAGRPQVGITSSGRIVWAWREQRTGATRDIFAASAPDAATAPTSDTRLDGDTTDKRDSDFPLMVVVGSSAYLVWQDVSTLANGGSDVVFVRSTNGGSSWSSERVIDDPGTKVSSSFSPTIAVDPVGAGGNDDVVAIAWEDRRQGTQVYASVSSNGGSSFSSAIRASNDAGQPIAGATSAPVIAAAGDGLLVVAYQNQLTNAKPHVFTASSIDGGATWTYTHAPLDQGTGAAISPAIVAAVAGTEPGAVSAWTDFRENGSYGDVYTALSR
ncbi:MAG TPA: sialidase family protein, partial [Kofleriaceae bacterium]|nr:sialidase family protein [Kofleriaceae bacterium]